MAETFSSEIVELKHVDLPDYRGTRIMMMPFKFEDEETIPDMVDGQPVEQWRPVVAGIVRTLHARNLGPRAGVGYLTIDEARVRAGTTHRRPGLHVDGVGPNGQAGGWGAQTGPWGTNGMAMVSSHLGSHGWRQEFRGAPGSNGDCEHLAAQLDPESEILFNPSQAFWCGAFAVHESLTLPADTPRQFCRVSLPSDAPWYRGYTENPLGINPAGPIHEPRAEFMAYRPQ